MIKDIETTWHDIRMNTPEEEALVVFLARVENEMSGYIPIFGYRKNNNYEYFTHAKCPSINHNAKISSWRYISGKIEAVDDDRWAEKLIILLYENIRNSIDTSKPYHQFYEKYLRYLVDTLLDEVERPSGSIDGSDLIGKRFGKWTVIGPEAKNKYYQRILLCRCNCEKQKYVREQALKSKKSNQCRFCGYKDKTKKVVDL